MLYRRRTVWSDGNIVCMLHLFVGCLWWSEFRDSFRTPFDSACWIGQTMIARLVLLAPRESNPWLLDLRDVAQTIVLIVYFSIYKKFCYIRIQYILTVLNSVESRTCFQKSLFDKSFLFPIEKPRHFTVN